MLRGSWGFVSCEASGNEAAVDATDAALVGLRAAEQGHLMLQSQGQTQTF